MMLYYNTCNSETDLGCKPNVTYLGARTTEFNRAYFQVDMAYAVFQWVWPKVCIALAESLCCVDLAFAFFLLLIEISRVFGSRSGQIRLLG